MPALRNEEFYSFMTPGVQKTAVDDLEDKWDNLGFQIRPLNGYVKYTWRNGEWDKGETVPAPYILLHINAGALHYGVSVFEGMKAFACKDGMIRLNNPLLNATRMQEGARKLRMPEVPEQMFIDGVSEAVRYNAEFVPPYGNNASMYIRPLLFASGPMLGLMPPAQEYTFFVTVLPAGGYFGKGSEEGVDALVVEEHDRAAPAGTGHVKAAGNYAADIEPVHIARDSGYGTTLYLDAKERKYIEEFSVCNFVGITKDGTYVTPSAGSILNSTTNKMMQKLAIDMGMKVECRPIDFDAEIENFDEIGMCGTAAVVVKVKSVTRGGKVYKTKGFDTLSKLRATLTGIQCGDIPDKHGWMLDICPVVTTK
jgi:branched-chain amino acid aminotransferase